MDDTSHRAGRRIVLVGGLIALLLVIGVQGTRPAPVIIGSNGIRPNEFVAVLPPDTVLCQRDQALPPGTGSLAMTIGTYGLGGPPVQAHVRDEQGSVLARGRLRAGWQEGRMRLPLDQPVSRDISDARLCLTNQGTHQIAVAGAVSSRAVAARIGGRRVAKGRISALYVSSRRQTHFARAGGVISAMQGPGLWGEAAPWAVLALGTLAGLWVVRTLW